MMTQTAVSECKIYAVLTGLTASVARNGNKCGRNLESMGEIVLLIVRKLSGCLKNDQS